MLVPCKVSMDGVPGTFKARRNEGEFWNGWAMPYMTKESATAFMDAFNENGGNMVPDAYYDPAQDAFCFPNEETYEVAVSDGVEYRAGVDVAPAVTIDGRTLYDFSNLGWCFWLL